MRPIEDPVVKSRASTLGETETTHPAFAQIGASRVNGSAFLYGSDFRHNSYVSIRLHRSQLNRGLSNDWHFGREEIVEVALSEAQWASFVSSLNMGTGTPCTITSIGGKVVPGLPAPENRVDQFAGEMSKNSTDAIKVLETIRTTIAQTSLSGKAKEQIGRLLDMAVRDITSSNTFVAKQFGEHMETIVEHAKTEVNAYVTSAVQRAGLEALASGRPVLAIEDQK